METKNITCIRCPLGCQVQVTLKKGQIAGIENNRCARGKQYATDEVLHPTRVVTSLIPLSGQAKPLSVKTAAPIPKQMIGEVLQAIRGVHPSLPIAIGDVVLPNVCGTGVDVVATCALE